MPVEKMLITESPRPTRNKRSILESTQEWLDFKTHISEGMRENEVLIVRFTPAEQQKLRMKHIGRAFRDRAREYIRERNLKYDVERFQSEGTEIIRITGRAVLAPQKAFAVETQAETSKPRNVKRRKTA